MGWACLGGIALGMGLKVWLFAATDIAWEAIYTSTATRMDALLGGGFVAWSIRFPEAAGLRRLHRTFSLAGMLLLGMMFSWQPVYFGHIFSRFTASFLTSFYALAFPLLLFFLVDRQTSLLHRVLSWKPFAFVARISYGMYISHFLIWHVVVGAGRPWIRSLHNQSGLPSWFLAFGITLTLTVLISWFLYEMIERPLLKLKRFFPYETPAETTPGS